MVSVRVPSFLPSTSGFRFSNSFPPGIPVTTISIPGVGAIPVGDASNGVCGGMVYAAMDLFLAQPRLLPPATTSAPAGGSTLMNYILARLIDGFALQAGARSNALRYVDFMSTLDHDTWVSRGIPSIIANYEWPQIKADIDAGRPSPIGLVGGVWVWPTNIAAKIDMLHHCHCVLAYGYDLDDASNLTLLVYDPNDPGADDSTIEMSLANPTHTTPISTPRITQQIEGNVTFRALFKHQFYVPVEPPAGVSPGPAPSGIVLQRDWRWCHKCQGLYFGGNPSPVCPAGGSHENVGSGNYGLPHNVAASDPHLQDDWRWCNKCQGLFFGGGLGSSRCPAGGTHAPPNQSGSGNYSLPHNVPETYVLPEDVPGPAPSLQANWRWCHKCQGLYFAGNPGPVCPAGGPHENVGSGNYSLPGT
jgi:hypothetical protein